MSLDRAPPLGVLGAKEGGPPKAPKGGAGTSNLPAKKGYSLPLSRGEASLCCALSSFA
jgi:hypothetical protein